jgi:hypothetical protein|tara:strand:+ start:3266 stop:3568 length:303 start_codon:yes stop_codon:yes gene_type:complete
MSHENIMETFAEEYVPAVNNKILHENDNVYLLRIWGGDCNILDEKLFEGNDKTAHKACNVLQHLNKDSKRGTYEIYTKDLGKILHKNSNHKEQETHDIFT